jgi:hypothetical protein
LYDAAMPRLACWSCGRAIYTTAPLESLFAEERRCPRCGALLNNDRRAVERRHAIRRENPAEDPGPPPADGERRTDRRRKVRRRTLGDGATADSSTEGAPD